MKPRRSRVAMPLGDVDAFTPSPDRPVRSRVRTLEQDTHFDPHQHPWAQLAFCASGLMRVTVAEPSDTGPDREIAVMVTPARAVWIPPQARHAVSMVETADVRTLYIDASACPTDWRAPRVLEVSDLLRAMIEAMEQPRYAGAEATTLTRLLLHELHHAPLLGLGVPMPGPDADRRLRHLCQAVLAQPAEHPTLADWAAAHGASERTMARLFRDELGLGFQHWRQQAVLAHALPLLARGLPVSEVAARCGYASDSAFSAMFRTAMGVPPRHLRPGHAGTIAA